ncbi:MAG: heme-binding domain-containing protein [Bryobacteraceae bacterium]
MRRALRIVLLAVVAVLAVTSLLTWPQAPESPVAPLLAGAHVPPEVLATIERSCRDCHSEATQYPWYSYVAPASLLINKDVRRGREHLNLSRWGNYSLIRRERSLSEIANQVRDGDMPLAMYTLLHRGAKLSKAEADAIFRWTQTERYRLISESLVGNGR